MPRHAMMAESSMMPYSLLGLMPDAATEYIHVHILTKWWEASWCRGMAWWQSSMMPTGAHRQLWCHMLPAPPLGPIEHYIILKIISSTFSFEYIHIWNMEHHVLTIVMPHAAAAPLGPRNSTSMIWTLYLGCLVLNIEHQILNIVMPYVAE